MVSLESISVNPRRTALVVVDVQNDFCLDEAGCAYSDRQVKENRDDLTPIQDTIDNYLMPFIKIARKNNLYTAYIQATYERGQFEDMPDLCVEGTKGWEFYKVAPENSLEKVFRKNKYNAFEENELDGFLRENNINTTIISGVTTDNCVGKTTYGSFEKGFTTILLADCVLTAGYKIETAHKQKLEEFAKHPQIFVEMRFL